MGLKYFDADAGRERFKRRYVWAFWAFASGLALGIVLSSMVR